MLNRIIDISNAPARMSVRHRNLVIEAVDQPTAKLPLAELAVLVVSHPQVRYSQAVLAGLMDAGGVFITCNENRLPNGMLIPLAAHHTQVERFHAQATASKPLRKRLWRQVVRAKILAQSRLLTELHGEDFGLAKLVPQVRSGDPSNIEARAARRYWQVLFADADFRRDRNQADQNRLLNYGYAILRALVARAICGAGLHPSLGIHHHNRYSTYPLADDLMEPLRPAVDRAVVDLVEYEGGIPPLGTTSKLRLIEALTARYELNEEVRTLFDIAGKSAASLSDCFLGNQDQLTLPSV